MKELNKKRKKLFNDCVAATFPGASVARRAYLLADCAVSRVLYGADIMNYFHLGFYGLKHRYRKKLMTAKQLYDIIEKCNSSEDRKLLLRKPLFVKRFGDYLGRECHVISEFTVNTFLDFCTANRYIVVKPIKGQFGNGIELIDTEKCDRVKLYNRLKDDNMMVEQVIKQHRELAEFNPASINTMRIATMVSRDGKSAKIMFAMLKMGAGDSIVDNMHSGGMLGYIDEKTGIVETPAYDIGFRKYLIHPVSKKQILGFKIPNWESISQEILKVALSIPSVRYVGWDVAVGENGELILVEGNTNPGIAFPMRRDKNYSYADEMRKML